MMQELWVVYLMSGKKMEGMRAVCRQTDWDAMEITKPGGHQLIQAGITSEGEAELLARGTSGDRKPRVGKLR